MFALKLHTLTVLQDASDLVLGDIIEPTPVPFTYETIGWKIVFALVAILLIYIAYRLYKNYKKKQYLREAVAYIQDLQKQTDLDAAAYINAVMFQLKQTALHTFGRLEVARLYGTAWLQFLDSKVNGSNFKDDEAVILEAVYKQEVSESTAFNKEKFSNKSINWIKQHAR
ncbi:conserved hypothetical protein (DUF4381) [Formosa agariphila KMM 3901]|uniref:DUF4381 domain-containing protein n=1 Tax=Formosa agariphila (strain DSM 15362 / KCTC 12365 / LMG 23005 / KMM 3901 / M-2Alg 35-1) TaxID=1347342 RepID=T2KHR4_FORAG|nr:DUF4381 domain-containing protein [Formosa agariphila]CDF78392.1 conserved hypothetical protein (DUF4381) [Formosa agariphila KMM 3901]